MKFVDLSANPPKEVTVLTIREIAQKVNPGYGSYALTSTFREWIENESIETPSPAYTINEEEYWKPEQVADWQSIYALEIEREEGRKAERLAAQTIPLNIIVERLLEKAEQVAKRNSTCYTHNRGNSMQDGRRRVLELSGAIDFVNFALLGNEVMTKDQREKLNSFVAEAKSHVKMQ